MHNRFFTWRRLWPLSVLGGLAILFFAFDLDNLLTLDQLRVHQERLREFVMEHPLWAILGFIAFYVIVVVLSLPAASFLTVTGGFMFGWAEGALWAVTGATLGATLLFLIAKSSFGEYLASRAGPWVQRARQSFSKNCWTYMFMLRLVPAVPFFIANLLPAFLGVSLFCYVVTTFFGIMPGGLVYALIGAGLEEALVSGAPLSFHSLDDLLTAKMKIGLLALGALSILPLIINFMRKRKKTANHEGQS